MIKKLLILLFLFCFFLIPSDVQAVNFYIDSNFYYSVDSKGMTSAKIDVVIENATSERLARKYLLDLKNFEPSNIVVEDQFGKRLEHKEIRTDGNSLLEIYFSEPIAGIGNKTNFTVNFDTFTFANKVGDTWDISIPRKENLRDIREYQVTIKVPRSFGEEAFVSPEPSQKDESDSEIIYKYSKNKLISGNVNLTFGNFQTYSFKLNYHLENTLNQRSEVELAIPPDTPYQTVIYNKIDPKPINIIRDDDGNWIAKYLLDPKERMEVKVEGYVNIFAFYRKNIIKTEPSKLLANMKSSEYWDINDPTIRDLSERLRTPEAIYNYVVSTLTYDYSRVTTNTKRLGAVGALNNTDRALCMEFTDLFIALSRAAGIPAREINGYAYSNNPKIQPLSLVTDILHAWPEYWQEDKQIWIPVDPTWESTTAGRDYFNSFDVNHFTFVIHGSSDTVPYPPASYKLDNKQQKDIVVNIAELPIDTKESLLILANIPYNKLATKIPLTISIHNEGSTAVYDRNIYVYNDNELIQSYFIDFIPPFGKQIIEEDVNYGLFGTNAPENITVVMGDIETNVPTNKNDVLVFHLLVLSGFVSSLVILIFLRTRPKINIDVVKYVSKIKNSLMSKYNKIKERNKPIYQNEDEEDTIQQV